MPGLKENSSVYACECGCEFSRITWVPSAKGDYRYPRMFCLQCNKEHGVSKMLDDLEQGREIKVPETLKKEDKNGMGEMPDLQRGVSS